MNDDAERKNVERRHELNARDRELAQRLTQTLNHSVDALDPDIRARLAAMRHAALSRSRTRHLIGGLAIAASFIAVISLPWLAHRHTATSMTALKSASDDAAYLNVDPQMLEDMDMLQAIGERE